MYVNYDEDYYFSRVDDFCLMGIEWINNLCSF
jgi:hypothetical protein